ncbi:hypothetical protein DICPUDRAFT_74399 [Dictyostelium purpureum]|uniref:Uncharacterized protein n=1 Tax=Dictyostelium purpureum TaxID=5786 RepID=F0Z7M1_DICPU|nr:uncharacterized protein DICPUDRAFT_74399 [Dictyostelium purpureum]EGC40088.1 hypothetical protein DICPUDRAFT_74399 [Dictyostelium purpureum]|eukprot:XP_003283437.1 hypothetical protein DICPUDRAFT_74399 [Dictyostelium purpureum]
MSDEEKVKQLVEFLAALVDDRFKEKFTELSKAPKDSLVGYIQTLEDWALTLGVSEQKQLQVGKLLGILNDPDELYEDSEMVLENNHNMNIPNNININNNVNNINSNFNNNK